MLSFIETENFKKLGNFRADFTDGTNLILGDNGMGKTTIFNVVRFALYGTASIAASSENIPTWGHTTCKVVVGFTNDFLVVRTLKDCKIYRCGDEGSLTENPALKVAEGSKACTEWVKEHLGLDYKMFSIFNMSMQGETGALITLGATELNRIVENFSGVGILDKVIKSLSKESALLEGALGTVEHTDLTDHALRLAASKGAVIGCTETTNSVKEQSIEAKQTELETSQSYTLVVNHNTKVDQQLTKQATASSKVDTLKPQVKKLQRDLGVLVEQRNEIDVNALTGELNTINLKLSEFNSDSQLHSNYETQLQSIETQQATYAKNSLQEDEVASSLISLEKSIAAFETCIVACEDSISSKLLVLKTDQDKITEFHEVLVEKRGEYKDAQNALEHGSCEKCQRPFENFDEELATTKRNLARTEGETARANHDEAVEQLNTSQQSIRDEQQKIREIQQDIRDTQSKIKQLPNHGTGNAEKAKECQAEIDSIKLKISTVEAKWEDFDDEDANNGVSAISQQLNDTKNLDLRIEGDEKALDNAKLELQSATEVLNNIEVGEKKDVDSTRKLWEQCVEISNNLATELENVTEKLQEAQRNLDLTQTEFDRLTKDNKKFEEFNVGIDRAKRLVKFLRDSRTKYMDGVWSLVLGAASGFVDKTTGGWITGIGRNKNGDFTFTENGIVAPVYSEASGAQKEFIGVALRIGLGMSLQGANAMLMLDEPTAGMREENADKLATGLLSVSGQKIIITHRQSERLMAANVVNL